MSSSSLSPPPYTPVAANLRSTTATAINRSYAFSSPSSINCTLKQKHKRERRSTPSPIPSDNLASLIAGLERLFHDGGSDPPESFSDPGRPVRVAYQGVRGSYCQEAAALAFPSPITSESFPCFHMEDAFAALEEQSADRAIVPAENSLDGPIDRNLDLLLRHESVKIIGELVVPVNHCLLGLAGGGLRRVVSHPQALAHCESRLHEIGLEVEEVDCAADAAKYIAENRISDTAVIGNRICAQEFGLRVIEENLQGQGGNFTRFLQLGLGSAVNGSGRGARKTTVAFALERGPSDLFRAMWCFESRGVRVTRVDHRPNRSRPVRVVEREAGGPAGYLDYVYVLDLEGSESDASVAAALAGLREFAGLVRVLGSYTCGSGHRERKL